MLVGCTRIGVGDKIGRVDLLAELLREVDGAVCQEVTQRLKIVTLS
jgi:hypothetical protein